MTTTRPDHLPGFSLDRAFVLLLSAPIHFYRSCISPFTPPSCGYQPTCSAYALEALDTHGALKGLALTVKRLLRCHPIKWLGGSSGFDPVPPRKVHNHE